MIIGRLRPDKKSKYGTKSGRPRAKPMDNGASRSHPRDGRSSHSLLEQLPTELLQDIFLFSANLTLPLCSRQLLAALTSDHLKFELTLQILVFQRDIMDQEERSLLLTRRFFTWEFLVRYVAFAHTRVAVVVEVESDSDEDLDSDEDEGYAATERSVTSKATSRTSKPDTTPTLHEVDANLTTMSTDAVSELRRDDVDHFIDADDNVTTNVKKLQLTASLEGLRGLDMPEKLLHNGWDDDRLRLLRLLIAFNCTVSRSSSASVAAEQGIMEAIAQGREEVVLHMLGAQISVEPQVEMLREAMKQTNLSIVQQLIASAHGEMDTLDPQVWRLLEEHMAWRKREKNMVEGWLRDGIQDVADSVEADFAPRLRDIEAVEDRWQ